MDAKREQAERDYEYYKNHAPVEKQMPREMFLSLPSGPSQHERWYEENIDNQHEVFNCRNFPTPPTFLNRERSYTSKCYDYPRK
jgi:hypothetical protein